MRANFDMPHPADVGETQQIWLEMVRSAIELTAQITKTDLPEALKIAHNLLLEANKSLAVDHNAQMIQRALTELTLVASGRNPFEDEDDDE